MSEKLHFVYKLIPPRRTFFGDQSEQEAKIMADHIEYWTDNLRDGKAVAFGPVIEPDAVWGLGVVEVDSLAEAENLRDSDPAVTSGLASAEIHPMPIAIVRPRGPGSDVQLLS